MKTSNPHSFKLLESIDVEVSIINENTLLLEVIDTVIKRRATPSEETAIIIATLNSQINQLYQEWILDTVPAYDSILIYFDFLSISPHTLINKLEIAVDKILASDINGLILEGRSTTHHIPVRYSIEDGWDLQRIATLNNISIDTVIAQHSQQSYRVFAVGFMPNFAYLGFVNGQIATPRQPPRKKVPKGAVGIAEDQTGLYPDDSPGGWNIVGRCTKKLPVFKVGDTVQFFAV